MKRVKNKIEESIIDYFLVCQEFYLFINSMAVDTERNFVLTKFTKKKEKCYITESDHNPMILDINIPWNSKMKKDRIEIFNLREKECQKEFFKNTNSGNTLTKCILNKDIRVGGKLWINHLKLMILRNFKKIRITRRENKEDMEISRLINKNRIVNEQEKEEMKKAISEKIFVKNRNIILDQIGGMVDNSSNLSRIKMWRIKQKVCPKSDPNYPIAKLDENGDLVTEKMKLKNLYTNVYKTRLKSREIRPDYAQLKELKNLLFDMRIKLSKLRKSEGWRMSDLIKVTKNLKTRKAADPKGLINELFKPGVAGTDLLESLLMLCNRVKAECEIPAFLKLTNITSIFKKRGSKTDLNNDRGVFNVMTVRSVIDNLIYKDYYDIIDDNMSDSNVGGRRGRNIRDNFITR